MLELTVEDPNKIDAVLKQLKESTGHDWFPIDGIFKLEPQKISAFPPFYDREAQTVSWGKNRGSVLVKLFVSTKTSEVKTVLAQSILQMHYGG